VGAVAVTRDARGRVVVPPRPPGMRRRALRDPVHHMISDLEREWGKAFATEAGYRSELFRRIGYSCGERSIGRVIKRLVRRGELGQERVAPYARRVDGNRSHPGTTHTWIIVRSEQRKSRRRAREEARQAQHKAARAQRERLECEQRAREDDAARELASRRHATAAVLGEVFMPMPKLAALLDRPSTSTEDGDQGQTNDERRRERIAEQLAALERAGFDVPKKPPDDG
jgi:hypothetical protein